MRQKVISPEKIQREGYVSPKPEHFSPPPPCLPPRPRPQSPITLSPPNVIVEEVIKGEVVKVSSTRLSVKEYESRTEFEDGINNQSGKLHSWQVYNGRWIAIFEG
jgi:hypothetical protein